MCCLEFRCAFKFSYIVVIDSALFKITDYETERCPQLSDSIVEVWLCILNFVFLSFAALLG